MIRVVLSALQEGVDLIVPAPMLHMKIQKLKLANLVQINLAIVLFVILHSAYNVQIVVIWIYLIIVNVLKLNLLILLGFVRLAGFIVKIVMMKLLVMIATVTE